MTRIAFAIALLAAPAAAHDWYPDACCNDKDCAPISSEFISWDRHTLTVHLTPENYRHTETGEPLISEPATVTYSMSSVQASPDGQAHVCVRSGVSHFNGVTKPSHFVICAWLPMDF